MPSHKSPNCFLDPSLCSSILLSYRQRAYYCIAHFNIPAQDRDDVFQEAALLLYSKGGAAIDPVAYFLGVLKWLCIAYHRRAKSMHHLLSFRDPYLLAEIPTTPDLTCHSSGPALVVLSSIARSAAHLPNPVERDGLRMAAEGYTCREIGAALGVGEPWVRKKLRTAREKVGGAR